MDIHDFKPALYVGTYRKYNEGSIAGRWVRLNKYNNAEEFFAAMRQLHSDEADPEFMFQDAQDIPDFLYAEAMGMQQMQYLYDALPVLYESFTWDAERWVEEHNKSSYRDDMIYPLTADVFDRLPSKFPTKGDAVSKVIAGSFNWSHDWITFNGAGNVESMSDQMVLQFICPDPIIRYHIDQARANKSQTT